MTESENLISQCKENAVFGMEHFLKVFSFVPEEKLHWTPWEGARSAMQIAAHTAITNGNFAQMMRAKRLPQADEIPAVVATTKTREMALVDPVEMEAIFRSNTAEVLSALDDLSADDVALTLDSGMGWQMPMTFLMKLPGMHAFAHTSQIDYLQTSWGDHEVHVG